MKAAAFDELIKSVRQAGQIRRGTLKSARTTVLGLAVVVAVYPVGKRGNRRQQ